MIFSLGEKLFAQAEFITNKVVIHLANKYVPVHDPSASKARALCSGARSLRERYEIITKYVSDHIVYDYVRAATIPKRNGLPNVDRCWQLRMGICLDISALTVGMLRAVSVPCSLVIGWADGHYHSWVEARIGGQRLLYDHDDPTRKIKTYKREKIF